MPSVNGHGQLPGARGEWTPLGPLPIVEDWNVDAKGAIDRSAVVRKQLVNQDGKLSAFVAERVEADPSRVADCVPTCC